MALNMNRDDDLQSFICALEAGIRSRITDYPDATPIVDQIFATLKNTDGIQGNKKPTRLPVCDYLDDAFSQARKGPKTIYELTNALTNIEQKLEWYRRPEAHKNSADFFNGHANAVIVGEGGLEIRQDVRIGVSLVAPRIDYPRHHHPPEELYIALAPGKWMQDDKELILQNSGDLIHNPPNCWHAMQASQSPLLAIWCLWLN